MGCLVCTLEAAYRLVLCLELGSGGLQLRLELADLYGELAALRAILGAGAPAAA